jgi:CheY-like chemotaxis protein
LVELAGGKGILIAEAETGAAVKELLRALAAETALRMPPVIVYASRGLSQEEETELNKHAEAVVSKNNRFHERLLEEISLLLHRAEEPKQRRAVPAGLYDEEHMFKGKRVLLADDDMRNVFALSGILEEKGMEVIVAEDGGKALKALAEEERIDLVLMDIMMPEMEGCEAMRHIRQQPQFRSLPIIALTAKAMKEDRAKCIEAGASDYLAKPIDVEQLLVMLRIWLSPR